MSVSSKSTYTKVIVMDDDKRRIQMDISTLHLQGAGSDLALIKVLVTSSGGTHL